MPRPHTRRPAGSARVGGRPAHRIGQRLHARHEPAGIGRAAARDHRLGLVLDQRNRQALQVVLVGVGRSGAPDDGVDARPLLIGPRGGAHLAIPFGQAAAELDLVDCHARRVSRRQRGQAGQRVGERLDGPRVGRRIRGRRPAATDRQVEDDRVVGPVLLEEVSGLGTRARHGLERGGAVGLIDGPRRSAGARVRRAAERPEQDVGEIRQHDHPVAPRRHVVGRPFDDAGVQVGGLPVVVLRQRQVFPGTLHVAGLRVGDGQLGQRLVLVRLQAQAVVGDLDRAWQLRHHPRVGVEGRQQLDERVLHRRKQRHVIG